MPRCRFPGLEQDFARIHLKHGGVFASANLRYGEAIFGRDSLEVAEDVLAFMPEVVEEIVLMLVRLQGTEFNALNEEEPGKIHHEYRAMIMDGKPISPHGKIILNRLARAWGGQNDRLIYYGSNDATPLFVRLVMRYCQQYGAALLDQPVERLNGGQVTVRQAVLAAINWLENALRSPRGLVTFCRTNPLGHAYQTWKDSRSSYLHLDGLAANYNRPMAALEVQGYAYDALVEASELGLALTHDELTTRRWLNLAQQLQSRVIEYFWMPGQRFWAQAVDEDDFGRARQVATLTSNAGLLLESRLLDTLPEEAQQEYIKGTVSSLYSPDFVTAVGVRCRSWQHRGLVNFADYHGSLAVWPKETYDVAKGFRRQGMVKLAEQLERRIMNGIHLSGSCYELWYVNGNGQVAYNPIGRPGVGMKVILGTNLPETVQSWTISAALAIQHNLTLDKVTTQPSWRTDIEKRLLARLPEVELLADTKQAEQAYPSQNFYLDLKTAAAKERIFINKPFSVGI